VKITAEMEDEFVAAAYQPHEQITASVAAGLEAVLAMPEVRRQVQLDACRACPVNQPCPSCTRDSQCECYEHQHLYPPDADIREVLIADEGPVTW
jgi:hypothetical protein